MGDPERPTLVRLARSSATDRDSRRYGSKVTCRKDHEPGDLDL